MTVGSKVKLSILRKVKVNLDGLTVVNSPTVGGEHISIAHAQQCLGLVPLNSVSAWCELLGLSSRRAIFQGAETFVSVSYVHAMSEEESTAADRGTEDGEPVSQSVLSALIDAAVEKALTSRTHLSSGTG